MAVFVRTRNPPDHVVVTVKTLSAVVVAKGASRHRWVAVWEEVPRQVKASAGTVYLSPVPRIRGLPIKMDGPRVTVAPGNIRRNGKR